MRIDQPIGVPEFYEEVDSTAVELMELFASISRDSLNVLDNADKQGHDAEHVRQRIQEVLQ